MHDNEEQQMPDVSTEPQRQALDEMSRQLVEKLNDMVREQHERARRFAATQHSLSPLPGVQAPPPPAEWNDEAQTAHFPAPHREEPPAKKPFHALLSRNARPKLPQDFSAKSADEPSLLPAWKSAVKKSGEKSSESGCGTVPTIIAIIILVIILRSCS